MIREVANAGLGREDVLAFWFGEGDQPTPAFIREAASQALVEGHTFYTHNLGRAGYGFEIKKEFCAGFETHIVPSVRSQLIIPTADRYVEEPFDLGDIA